MDSASIKQILTNLLDWKKNGGENFPSNNVTTTPSLTEEHFDSTGQQAGVNAILN